MHRMEADREKSVLPPALMGTGDGISTFCLILIELINAAHYDVFITSLGLLVVHEKNLTRVFTLRTSDMAVLIKLYDGSTLYWIGRKIYHCTGIGKISDNYVHSCIWQGKVHKSFLYFVCLFQLYVLVQASSVSQN